MILRAACVLLLFALAAGAQAQDPEADAGSSAADDGQVTEFDAIRVIERRPEWVDPFAFRPLFDPDANAFQRYWNEPPSVEDVAMRGGYVQAGIDYVLLRAAGAVTRLPGWQHQVQPATARPPPLDEAQRARAARLQEEAGL